MGDVIQQVSEKVVMNVIGQLSSPVGKPVVAASPVCTGLSPLNTVGAPQLVSHRKLKEPPCFGGDSSDCVSVREWEDLMRTFVKRSNLGSEEQVEEILIHLRGKAKDVVRCGTRNSGMDITRNPEAIYVLLRKHFDSAPCSPLPLADFYTTLP